MVFVYMFSQLNSYCGVTDVSETTIFENLSDESLKKHYRIETDSKWENLPVGEQFFQFELFGLLDNSGKPCDCKCINQIGSYNRNSTDNSYIMNNVNTYSG